MRALAVAVVATMTASPQAWCTQWYGGFVAGPTYATLGGSLIERADGAYGAIVGLDLGVPLPARWLIDAEIRWVQKGASNVPIDQDVFDFRYDFIEAVVTGNHVFPLARMGWAVSPYVGAALALDSRCGFRVDGTSHYAACASGTPGGTLHGPELSIPLGVAFRHVYPGGSRLALEVRYSVGATKVLHNSAGFGRNRVLEFLFSFGVPLGAGA